METIADQLPRRYRAVLDAIDRVELRGERPQALRWRSAVIDRYSRAWDQATLCWMDDQLERIEAFERSLDRAADRIA